MNSKTMMLFQYVYKYFQVSLYFWLYLIKGLVVYSLVPTLSALFLVLHDINKGEDEEKSKEVKELFREYYETYKSHRLPSFLYTIIFILLYTCLFFVTISTSAFTLILLILFIYMLVMALLMITYSTIYVSFKKMNVKMANMHAFVAIIRNPIQSVALIMVFILLYLGADYNFAFFVIFGPFLYGLGVILSLAKLMKEE